MQFEEYTIRSMCLVRMHRCLTGETRLRILRLLAGAPLCVGYFRSVLEVPQMTVSTYDSESNRTSIPR